MARCLLRLSQKYKKTGYFDWNICRACRRDYCFLEGYSCIEDEFNPDLEPIEIKTSASRMNRE